MKFSYKTIKYTTFISLLITPFMLQASSRSSQPPMEADAFYERIVSFSTKPALEDFETLASHAKNLLLKLDGENEETFTTLDPHTINCERSLLEIIEARIIIAIEKNHHLIMGLYDELLTQTNPCLEKLTLTELDLTPHKTCTTCPLCALTRALIWDQHIKLLQTQMIHHFENVIWDELDHFDLVEGVPFPMFQAFKNISNTHKNDFLKAPYEVSKALEYLGEKKGHDPLHAQEVEKTFEKARHTLQAFFNDKKEALLSTSDYAPFAKALDNLETCYRTITLVGTFYVTVEGHLIHTQNTALSQSLFERWDTKGAPYHVPGCPKSACVQEGTSKNITPDTTHMAPFLAHYMNKVLADALLLLHMGFKQAPLSPLFEAMTQSTHPDNSP